MKRNNEGFTLIEVMVSILVLGLVVIPICSGLIMAVRINEQAEDFLQAKLAVSSAMETMMAEGIRSDVDYDTYDTETLDYTVTRAMDNEVELPYYDVTVSYKGITKDPITVTTVIRQATPAKMEGGGGE